MSKKKRSRHHQAGGPGGAKAEPRPATASAPAGREKGSASPKRRLNRAGLALAAVALVAGAGLLYVMVFSGRTKVRRDSRLNVLLITLDTTRADRLGAYGYARAKSPNLDSLARNGVRFENVYCQVPLTLPSHCSIMTGTYPFSHGVHDNGTYELGPDHVTVAKILKEKGFKTAAVVASFSVDSRFGLAQGFDFYDDDIQPGLPFKPMNSERKGEEVVKVFSSWLDKSGSEPFFAWVHFFDPHLPYQPPSPFQEEFAAEPYDGEIAYMDACVGKVIEKLRGKNLLGRTLIIAAGDHGEAFGEKVETGHGLFLYDDTLRVPLIFFSENRLPRGKVIRSRVRLIDIFPSIMDLLGLPKPEPVQGLSLVPYIEGRKRGDLESYIESFYPRDYFGWSELVGFIKDDWKYIRAPKPELYNLKADPRELSNSFASSGRVASSMNARLEELIKGSAGLAAAKGRKLTAEEEERLRSLGYTSFAGAGAKSEYPDPKDKLDLLRLIQQAQGCEFEGKYEESVDIYKQLVPLIPDASSSYVGLALAQARLKRFDEAIQTLQLGIARIPNSIVLLSRLGHTYLVTGRLEEAYKTMAEVLKLNPKYVEALTVSAGVMDTFGRLAEARGFYERAIAVEPKSLFLRMSYATNLVSSGLIDRAIDVYKKLCEDYPEDAALRQYLGIAHGLKGDYALAIENLKQAVSLRPTPTAYFNLAVAYRNTGDIKEAIRYLGLYLDDPTGEGEANISAARAELARLEKALPK
jgi:arylsulfatase A-like enzyme/tetratricopeptide (TPR) repeat protein